MPASLAVAKGIDATEDVSNLLICYPLCPAKNYLYGLDNIISFT
jgi:hypothetical protein